MVRGVIIHKQLETIFWEAKLVRTIKFRAWHIRRKRMMNVNGLEFTYFKKNPEEPPGDLKDVWLNGEIDPCRYQKVVLMQYTGIKDKHDIEIFEGDILKNCKDDLGKVIWDDNYCRFYISFIDLIDSTPLVYVMDFDIAQEMEIIGNIFENSKLLAIE